MITLCNEQHILHKHGYNCKTLLEILYVETENNSKHPLIESTVKKPRNVIYYMLREFKYFISVYKCK